METIQFDDTAGSQARKLKTEYEPYHHVKTQSEKSYDPQADSQSLSLRSLSLSDALKATSGTEIFRMLSPFQRAQIQQIFRKSSRIDFACPFLDVFPLEIRNIVYGYLLINPELGKASSVRIAEFYGKRSSYGLVPQILCTCRQIYNECIPILYGLNQFLIECVDREARPYMFFPRVNISPLTRYLVDVYKQYEHHFESYLLDDIAILKHVKHWKVVITAIEDPFFVGDERCMMGFCGAISLYPPRSIEVLVIPKGVEKTTASSVYKNDRRNIWYFERYLRNIESFTFRSATIDEIPDSFIREDGPANQLMPVLPSSETANRIAHSVTRSLDDDPSFELPHIKFQCLVEYAQTFERIADFKTGMSIKPMMSVMRQNIDRIPGTPLRDNCWHPVEIELCLIPMFLATDDQDGAKACRKTIVEYLEPQYRRIATAANNVNQFVKRHKNSRLDIFSQFMCPEKEFFEPYPDCEDDLEEILDLVKVYAATFKRDMPPDVQAAIKKQQVHYDARFDFLPREQAFVRLDHYFKYATWYRFVEALRIIIDDCDKQYLEIREARKKLFNWDRGTENRDCDLDVGLNMIDEMVQWEVEEPFYGPIWDSSGAMDR
ncbi:hypothetical protein NHQ30_005466 [Ciborinia camelliae]|nr:hypothetical protein NHQ30_005466 [Ciborinia camelliae]